MEGGLCRFVERRAQVRNFGGGSLSTAADFKSQTVKDLTQLARKWGVAGYSSMKKDDLVVHLLKESRKRARGATSAQRKRTANTTSARRSQSVATKRPSTTSSRRSHNGGNTSAPRKENRVQRRLRKNQQAREQHKNLAAPLGPKHGEPGKDTIILMVLDSFWLQACWEVTHQAIDRVQAAMAEQWHGAIPIIRLLEVDRGSTTGTAERLVRDIPIHGGVRNWYLDIQESLSYQVVLGYLAEDDKFYTLCRSNIVTPPAPGSGDPLNENWQEVAEDYERIYALSGGNEKQHSGSDLRELFEERLRRPMGAPVVARFGIAGLLGDRAPLPFEVDAELIVYGSTSPDAHITMSNEPLKLRPDGTFTVRMTLPDRRQVIPVVATTKDGVEKRTIVLAIERNTKTLDPVIRE